MMGASSRLFSLLTIFFLLVLVSANAFQRTSRNLSLTEHDRVGLHNDNETVLYDVNGQQLNYTKAQLKAQASEARPKEFSSSPSTGAALSSSGEANWSYATLGSGIGMSNLLVAQNGASPEIYTTAGFNAYWMALRYNATTHDYDQT